MSIKITIPNTSSDVLTFGSANTPTAAQIAGIDSGSSNGQLALYTTASGTSTERVRVDASGNVGIGTSSPTQKLDVSSTTGTQISVGSSAGDTSSLFLAAKSPSYDAGYSTIINTNTANGTAVLSFKTRNNYTDAERMRIDGSGNVLVTSAAGLGYGTGSGGTVTQATDKGTAVTLNKPTGQITMNAAALAANTTVGFVLNNSLIALIDVVNINIQYGGSAAAYYNVWATPVSAGQTVIYVRNISAGSRSEALVLNFAILKGATS